MLEPQSPDSLFSCTAGIDKSPSVTSIRHLHQKPLVDSLFVAQMETSSWKDTTGYTGDRRKERHHTSSAVQKRLLKELLPIVSLQFSSASQKGFRKRTAVSRSVLAAQATLAAMNHLLCVETASKGDKNEILIDSHDTRVRLLLIALWLTICRNISGDKLEAVLASPLLDCVSAKPSSDWSIATIADVIRHSILSLLHCHWSNSVAWLARDYLKDFLLVLRRFCTDAVDRNAIQERLVIVELFVRRLLKEITLIHKFSHRIDELKIAISIHADCLHLLPCCFHSSRPSRRIRVFSHPLLLLKHSLLQIIRSALWNKELFFHASLVLGKACKTLQKHSAHSIQSLQKLQLSLVLKFVQITAELLRSEALAVSKQFQVHSMLTNKHCDVLVLGKPWKSLLSSWALQCASSRCEMLIQQFLFPILEQFAASEVNWKACQLVLEDILANTPQASMRPMVLKWIVSLSAHRHTDSSSEHQISMIYRLPDAVAARNTRIFAIRMLCHRLLKDPSSTTSCIYSLFASDASEEIHTHVAAAMMIHGLNSTNQIPPEPFAFSHGIYCECEVKHTNTSIEMQDKLKAIIRVPPPFAYIEAFLDRRFDNIDGDASAGDVFMRELDTIGLWAYHITRHICFDCPLFESSGFAIQQLQLKAIKRFLEGCMRRVLYYQKQKKTVKSVSVRRCFVQLVGGCLSGSFFDGSATKASTEINQSLLNGGIKCSSDVLGLALPILRQLRFDTHQDVRHDCIELFGRLLSPSASSSPANIRDDNILALYKLSNGVDDGVNKENTASVAQNSVSVASEDKDSNVFKLVKDTLVPGLSEKRLGESVEQNSVVAEKRPQTRKQKKVNASKSVATEIVYGSGQVTIMRDAPSVRLHSNDDQQTQDEEDDAEFIRQIYDELDDHLKKHGIPVKTRDYIVDIHKEVQPMRNELDLDALIGDLEHDMKLDGIVSNSLPSGDAIVEKAHSIFEEVFNRFPKEAKGSPINVVHRSDPAAIFEKEIMQSNSYVTSDLLNSDSQVKPEHKQKSIGRLLKIEATQQYPNQANHGTSDVATATTDETVLNQNITSKPLNDSSLGEILKAHHEKIDGINAQVEFPSALNISRLVECGFSHQLSPKENHSENEPVLSSLLKSSVNNASEALSGLVMSMELQRNEGMHPRYIIPPVPLGKEVDVSPIASPVANQLVARIRTPLPPLLSPNSQKHCTSLSEELSEQNRLKSESKRPMHEDTSMVFEELVTRPEYDDPIDLDVLLDNHGSYEKVLGNPMNASEQEVSDSQPNGVEKNILNTAASIIEEKQRRLDSKDHRVLTESTRFGRYRLASTGDSQSGTTDSSNKSQRKPHSRKASTTKGHRQESSTLNSTKRQSSGNILNETLMTEEGYSSERPQAAENTTTYFIQRNEPVQHPLVRTRLNGTIELVLRHLVFDKQQKQEIDYESIYSEGLVYGSMMNIAALPLSTSGGTNESKTTRETSDENRQTTNATKAAVIHEALHPLLKQVFKLDMSLFVAACQTMEVPFERQQNGKNTKETQLSKWLCGLSLVHEHLLRISRILFRSEKELQSELSLAQAIVILKDQLAVDKIIGQSNAIFMTRGLQLLKTAIGEGASTGTLNNAIESIGNDCSNRSVDFGDLSFLQWMQHN